MLIEEIKNIKSDVNEYKKFGITVGIVLVAIALVLSYYGKPSYQVFSIIGGLLIIAGIVTPKLLSPFHKVWMALAVVLGFFMSRLILTILFYFIITPLSFITKLLRKDFLDLKLNKDKKSYWNIREEKEYSRIDTERQF
jgi:hypothetical protein